MTIPHDPGCYILNHVATGKFYIGSTSNLYRRHQQQLTSLRLGVNHNPELQRLFDEDDYFTYDYVATVDRDAAYDMEQDELDRLLNHQDCVNVLNDARKAWKPGTVPEDQIAQLRARNTIIHSGKKYRQGMTASDETRAKLSESIRINWETRSDRRTDRTERPARLGARGRVATDEQRSNMRTASIERGIKRSKGVCICGVDYHNAGYAAIAHNVTRRTIVQRIASDDPRWEEWKYA